MPECDVEGTDTATHGCGERALDGDQTGLHGVKGCLRQPFAGGVEGLLAGEDFRPDDAFLAVVGFLYGSIDHANHDGGDVDADAVALNVVNHGVVWDLELAVFHGYRCTCHVSHHCPPTSPSRMNRPCPVHARARGMDRRQFSDGYNSLGSGT